MIGFVLATVVVGLVAAAVLRAAAPKLTWRAGAAGGALLAVSAVAGSVVFGLSCYLFTSVGPGAIQPPALLAAVVGAVVGPLACRLAVAKAVAKARAGG